MKIKALAPAIFLVLLSCVSPQPPGILDASRRHGAVHARDVCELCSLYHRVRNNVVRIWTNKGQGAGIILNEQGRVVTNSHVVMGATEITIENLQGEEVEAKILKADAKQDLALLLPLKPGLQWNPAVLEIAATPPIGSTVYVIGHPLGLGWTLTQGIVSGNRAAGEVGDVEMIQTDAAISPGNSGGPLLDSKGRIIGIVTSKATGGGAENVAFARPVSALLKFLE